MISYPCRLVLHEHTQSHGDLFILFGELLITYEWPASDLSPVFSAVSSGPFEIHQSETGLKLIRKADHRLFYWDHSGEVSGNRGFIRQIARGNIFMTNDSFPQEICVKI